MLSTYRIKSASSWGCELKCVVSCWNISFSLSASSWGCELKYNISVQYPGEMSSASSWGCELKWTHINRYNIISCQPLREAVSWNVKYRKVWYNQPVSLFVRLWVEMEMQQKHLWKHSVSLFVRLWVEIISTQLLSTLNPVSLFVRLWVEIVQCHRVYNRL